MRIVPLKSLFFLFFMMVLTKNSFSQIYTSLNLGSAYYTSGLRNLDVHAAAVNENTPTISKEMDVSNLGYGAGFQLGIKQNGVTIYTGWEFRRNGFSMNDVNGNELDWRLTARKLTVLGMRWDNEQVDFGFGVDIGRLRLTQNSKGINVFNQGLATSNTNGWVDFYEKKKIMFGAHFFFGYQLTDWLGLRSTYFWNFIPVEFNFAENSSEVFEYKASYIDLSIVFRPF